MRAYHWSLRRLAVTLGRRLAGQVAVPGEPEGPPPPPEELINFLRQLGVALCQAGDGANRVTAEMDEVAAAYGVPDVHFFVLPTGVFVRIGTGPSSTVDFAPTDLAPLRLDQISELYALLEQARTTRVAPADGVARLAEIRATEPRFPWWVRVIGHAGLTAGLGLVLNADPRALAGYLVLGAIVGLLRLLADRVEVLAMALPVVAAMLVTVLVYQFGEYLVGDRPTQLLIPPLVTFLPGAALTMGAVEMAAGSLVGGSSRLVSGFFSLMLLAFGILAGTRLVGVPTEPTSPPAALGWWAPLVGVLVFGVGQSLNSSAPRGSLHWLLVTLYLAWGSQFLTTLAGLGMLSGFVGGLMLVPIAYFAQRHHGPPSQVVFLPAFWLLVPGALGLSGVSELVGTNAGSGLADLLSALLAVVAIALGVLVGSSLTRTAQRYLP